MAKSNKRIHQMTIAQWESILPDDDACKADLTRHRWPLGVGCARYVVGTFRKVSRKYLPLHVAEFQFRYNNRENDNIFAEAIKGC